MSPVVGSGSGVVNGPVAEQKTATCIMCMDPFLIEIISGGKGAGGEGSSGAQTGEKETSHALQNRFGVVKDLCNCLEYSPEDIPKQFSENMFPFCESCRSLVEKISTSHKVIQEENRRIGESLDLIQRKVADAELLGSPNPSVFSNDEKRMREVVLNRYRNKLIVERNLRNKRQLEKTLELDDQPEPKTDPSSRSKRQEDPLQNTQTSKASENVGAMTRDNINEVDGSKSTTLTWEPSTNAAIVDPGYDFSAFVEAENESLESALLDDDEVLIKYADCDDGVPYAYDKAEENAIEISGVGVEDQIPNDPLSMADIGAEETETGEKDSEVKVVGECGLKPQEVSVKKKRIAVWMGVNIYRITNDITRETKFQCGQCQHSVISVPLGDTTSVVDLACGAIVSHVNVIHTSKVPEFAITSRTSAVPAPSPKAPLGKRKFCCPEKRLKKQMKLLPPRGSLTRHVIQGPTSPTPPPPPGPNPKRIRVERSKNPKRDGNIYKDLKNRKPKKV